MNSMASPPAKKEGDISDSFASLSGLAPEPLPDRFRELKLSLAQGHEAQMDKSWRKLLRRLREENEIVAREGPAVIPEVQYRNLDNDLARLNETIRKRGAAVIRGVIPEDEARAYKTEIEKYVRKNPHTRGFPATDPQVFELYWSAPQLRARSHPNFMRAQKALMQSLWHSSDPDALVSLSQPLTYADRLRIRQPGDAVFALGPHQDGGSLERWEREGYGRGGVYDAVLAGDWERYDPWDVSGRVDAVTNLYNGLGACSMFRMFQGWLSMSRSGPNQGTLLVNPLLQLSTAYSLMRPFFRPIKALGLDIPQFGTAEREAFLDPDNWEFTGGEKMTSEIPGATAGHGMEFPAFALHPHLELERTMVHIPEVRPGDFVVWHCDTIHSVDKTHNGTGDSSVLYIPVCPVTEQNAEYLVRQRSAFREGTPGPDFPGGKGESEHIDRPTEEYVRLHADLAGLQAFGLEKLSEGVAENPGALAVIRRANAILGF
ncbi:DUF1479-domain-containing protein [Pleurostoma richardsiae]|uniref:DUF1479-domain-containing protein n=1 Tax=Pleurostoma richardsiae TaxID=41990 RepID=A0AA38VQV4_9PEZI|nr:DUF1479-domain-containing protein [Pleurostoma richardsiae]